MANTNQKHFKLVEIGPYPPPASGWSVRIKYVKEAFDQAGCDCRILNLGSSRKTKSPEYIDVQGGTDYLKKLVLLRMQGYHFHMHMNAQAVKGPILSLIALVVSMLTFERAALTFHGGIEQLYFPKRNGKKMYLVIYLNFLFSKLLICNNKQIKKEIINYGPFIGSKKIKPIPAFSVQYLNYQNEYLGKVIEEYFAEKSRIISCYIVLRKGFFIETLIDFLRKISSEIGVILVGIRVVEDEEVSLQYKELQKFQKQGKILMVENLDRNQFLTLLERSDLCLRTPISDGVASSVLEALYLNTPVLASENGRRPKGVITYQADNAEDLNEKVEAIFHNFTSIKENHIKPKITDTVKIEIESLTSSFN